MVELVAVGVEKRRGSRLRPPPVLSSTRLPVTSSMSEGRRSTRIGKRSWPWRARSACPRGCRRRRSASPATSRRARADPASSGTPRRGPGRCAHAVRGARDVLAGLVDDEDEPLLARPTPAARSSSARSANQLALIVGWRRRVGPGVRRRERVRRRAHGGRGWPGSWRVMTSRVGSSQDFAVDRTRTSRRTRSRLTFAFELELELGEHDVAAVAELVAASGTPAGRSARPPGARSARCSGRGGRSRSAPTRGSW